MNKTIALRGLKTPAKIGILEAERKAASTLIFDIDLTLKDDYYIKNDEIGASLDYRFIRQVVFDVLDVGHIDLLETVAQRVVSRLFVYSPIIAAVSVAVKKPDIFDDCDSVGYQISASRERWRVQTMHNIESAQPVITN